MYTPPHASCCYVFVQNQMFTLGFKLCMLPLLAAVAAVSTSPSPIPRSTDKVIGIGVGTFIVCVAIVLALIVCIGARGAKNWKYAAPLQRPQPQFPFA